VVRLRILSNIHISTIPAHHLHINSRINLVFKDLADLMVFQEVLAPFRVTAFLLHLHLDMAWDSMARRHLVMVSRHTLRLVTDLPISRTQAHLARR
jgi:hypothetical protein